MNNKIADLEPKVLWNNFYSLTRIPRPSKKEAGIIAFIKDFGEKNGLETLVDEVGNVIIRKPATPGMENRKGIILQGHLDMVPQKNSDKAHDFEKDPIETMIDGDWVKAKGTTLGSDNGIGVAAAMAVLESKTIPHGPVEGLFTIDEETGMTGAFNLKAGLLKGSILLNLDSEDEGELYIGCAGGTNANVTFDLQHRPTPSGYSGMKIIVKGLKGGHSGLDINIGRGNSNKVLFRLLRAGASESGLLIAGIDGGSLRNAIPRESFAEVAVSKQSYAAFADFIKEFTAIVRSELSRTEPDLVIGIEAIDVPKTVMTDEAQMRFINAIYGCPNGVIRMSDAMPGLVETSTNLAIVKTSGNQAFVKCLLRSSVDSAKVDLENMVSAVFELAGAKVVLDGQYPGWKPNPESQILTVMQKVYQEHFGKIPEIKAIHAGLECGILGASYPHWDMISFGPTIRHPHSPDEKVLIKSVGKFWKFLLETLKSAPVS